MTAPNVSDRALIKALQGGLPLVSDPWAAIAEDLGISADDVLRRVQAMQESGKIRRVGAVPNHYALGMVANGMSVWDVDDGEISRLGPQVGALEFVTHCYRRPRRLPDWRYNLFAMVHGSDRAEVMTKVKAIADLLGSDCREHDVLFSNKILKKTGLRLAS